METHRENKISIVIPVYEMNGKGMDYLRNNIERILMQDYQNFEVIITDNSEGCSLCEMTRFEYGIKDARIKYYKNKDKKGICANTNFGIKRCTGDLIKVIYQDDYLFLDNCLSEFNKFANEYPEKKWFAFSRRQIKNNEPCDIKHPKWNPYILQGINTISAPSVIGIRNMNDESIYMDEALQMYADLSWFHRLFLKYGEPQYIHTTLIGVREWAGQAQHQISHEGLAKEKNYILDRYGIW